MSKQRTTLMALTEPQQIRELNRQLDWIWSQLLGGLTDDSISEETRDKWSASATEEIAIAVAQKTIGGENLLRNSAFKDSDDWTLSSGYAAVDDTVTYNEQNSIKIEASGLTEYGYKNANQTVSADKYTEGDIITLSAWVMSTDVSSLDSSVYIEIRLTVDGVAQYNTVTADGMVDNEWMRLTKTITIPANTTLVQVKLNLKQNGIVYYSCPKLEKGNTTTDWCPAVDEFYAGSDVLIRSNMIKLISELIVLAIRKSSTDESEIMRIDEDGVHADRIASPTVVPVYDGYTTLYVNPSATDAQVETGQYFRSLSSALDSVNYRYIKDDIQIKITYSSTLYDEVSIVGLCGSGTVTICAEGVPSSSSEYPQFIGLLFVSGCSIKVTLDYLVITAAFVSGNNYLLYVTRASYCEIKHSTLNGNAYTDAIVYIADSGEFLLSDCGMYNTSATSSQFGIVANPLSDAVCLNLVGNVGAATIFKADAGRIKAATTIPYTTGSDTSILNNGEINITGCSVNSGTTPPAYTPPTTYIYYVIDTRTHTAVYGWFASEKTIRQGYTESSHVVIGAMFFDLTTLRSDLSGKTINSATIFFACMANGVSYPRALGIAGITNTSASGSVTIAQDYGAIDTIAWYEEKTITIPNQAIIDLVAGTINSIVLYSGEDADDLISGKDYSVRYRRCEGYGDDGAPVLTVMAT